MKRRTWEEQVALLEGTTEEIRDIAFRLIAESDSYSDDKCYMETVVVTQDAEEYARLDTIVRERLMKILERAYKEAEAK